jgi:tRNA threonylcarbamoyl adenosine modification protein YeaZ
MILAFDTSSAACTAALFDGSGDCIASRDELIGRGHSERLVPMLAELLDGRAAAQIIVGVGPGSFTGIRVGIAGAHGLAIGWGAQLIGMSSLALLAAAAGVQGAVAAAVTGGHGELFVQEFEGATGRALTELVNLAPARAAAATTANIVVGSAASILVDARGWGEAREAVPSAVHTLMVHEELRRLPAKPVYARAADARPRQAA